MRSQCEECGDGGPAAKPGPKRRRVVAPNRSQGVSALPAGSDATNWRGGEDGDDDGVVGVVSSQLGKGEEEWIDADVVVTEAIVTAPPLKPQPQQRPSLLQTRDPPAGMPAVREMLGDLGLEQYCDVFEQECLDDMRFLLAVNDKGWLPAAVGAVGVSPDHAAMLVACVRRYRALPCGRDAKR